MRRLTLLVALAAALGAPTAWAATTSDVRARGNAFVPPSLTIASGDTVRWTNDDLQRHTVTFSDRSHDLLPGAPITITFDNPGTYRYKCDVHPSMTGSVVVQATSGSSTTSTTRRPTTTSTSQEARGSAITAPPDTSTTTTSTTTTTTVPTDDTTATLPPAPAEGAAGPPSTDKGDADVNGPSALAALLLLAVAGAAFMQARSTGA